MAGAAAVRAARRPAPRSREADARCRHAASRETPSTPSSAKKRRCSIHCSRRSLTTDAPGHRAGAVPRRLDRAVAASSRSTRSRITPASADLRLQRHDLVAVGGDERRRVGLHLEAGIGARHVVGDDQVDALARAASRAPSRPRRASRRRSRRAPASAGLARHAPRSARMSRVRTRRQRRGRRPAWPPSRWRPRPPACSRRRPRPSRWRRRHRPARSPRRASAPPTAPRTTSTPAGGATRRRSQHQHDVRAAPRRLGGDGDAHAPAGAVAQVAHRVEVLVRRSGGHQHACARPGTARWRAGSRRPRRRSRPARRGGPCPSSRRPGTPRPARRTARRGVASVSRFCCDRGVVQHVGVHRRRDQDGRPRRQVQRREEVVGEAVGEARDDVRGRRGHEQELRVTWRARCARCRRWRPAPTDR